MHTSPSQADVLNDLVADLVNLGLLAKHAHWNVVGPSFREMHLMLDELAEFARQGSDDLAERSRALGCHPDGRINAIAKSGLPTLDLGSIRDRDAVERFDAILAEIGARLHRAMQEFEDDPVTQDQITSTLGACEQRAWLFRAHCYDNQVPSASAN